MRPYRCVKCSGDQSRDTEATCVNCEGKHPANYKGCQKYKQYKEQILKPKPTTRNEQTETPKMPPTIRTNLAGPSKVNQTYAEIIRGGLIKNKHNQRVTQSTKVPWKA